jgi:hypothetical protein
MCGSSETFEGVNVEHPRFKTRTRRVLSGTKRTIIISGTRRTAGTVKDGFRVDLREKFPDYRNGLDRSERNESWRFQTGA